MTQALNVQDPVALVDKQYSYLLWRKHEQPKVLGGHYPEILATNGQRVRRMMSHHKQIIYQDFDAQETATTIIDRIDSSVTPGITLVGYAMFKKYPAVAILQTGQSPNAPGWLAFPYDSKTLQAVNADQTLSLHTVMKHPKLRIVSGGGIFWRQGKLIIHIALEQRGTDFMSQHPDFNLLEHLEGLELSTLSYRDGKARVMEVATSPTPVEPPRRVTSTRVEASFVLEPSIYKVFRKTDNQVWIKLSFKHALFCLPAEWCTFWMQVDINEPPNLLF